MLCVHLTGARLGDVNIPVAMVNAEPAQRGRLKQITFEVAQRRIPHHLPNIALYECDEKMFLSSEMPESHVDYLPGRVESGNFPRRANRGSGRIPKNQSVNVEGKQMTVRRQREGYRRDVLQLSKLPAVLSTCVG